MDRPSEIAAKPPLPHNAVMGSRGIPFTNPQSVDAIGKRLRMLRGALGHTQGEMAIAIGSGSGAQMWANYEAGYRRIATDHALALCERCGVTMDWVYRGRTEGIHPELLARIRSQEISEEQKSEDKAS